MELKDLRMELKLPVCVLKDTIDRTTNSQKNWVNALDTSVQEYAKKFKNRTLNYQIFGASVSEQGVCVVGFNSESNAKVMTVSLAKMAEKIAIQILKDYAFLGPTELTKLFTYVQDDLIAQFGENILLSYAYLDTKKGITPLNTSYYSPNNHIGCIATLSGGESVDVSKIAKIIAQNAICYYGDFWDRYKSMRKMCSDITEENFKEYFPDFVSHLLKQPLLFTEKGIDWRANFQTTIKQYLCNETKLLKCSAPILIKEIKLWGFE